MGKIPNNLFIKQIIPVFTSIVTTAEKYEEDKTSSSGLITDTTKKAGSLKEYQFVVSVGSSVRNCKAGDLVKINPMRYAIVKQKKQNSIEDDMAEHYKKEIVGFNFNLIELDGEEHIILQDSDIEYVISEYESMDSPTIFVDKKPLIVG